MRIAVRGISIRVLDTASGNIVHIYTKIFKRAWGVNSSVCTAHGLHRETTGALFTYKRRVER
jgi:hypothetical protein